MQWEWSQCCSSFRGGDAETVKSCSTEKLRRQGIVMRMHCSRFDLQRSNRRRKRKMVLELLLPKPGGHVLPPDFGQSWEVGRDGDGLGRYNTRRASESASCHNLGEDVP